MEWLLIMAPGEIAEPIRELGLHEIKVQLVAGVEATLRVEVIKQA